MNSTPEHEVRRPGAVSPEIEVLQAVWAAGGDSYAHGADFNDVWDPLSPELNAVMFRMVYRDGNRLLEHNKSQNRVRLTDEAKRLLSEALTDE